jgi:hypothetical protein
MFKALLAIVVVLTGLIVGRSAHAVPYIYVHYICKDSRLFDKSKATHFFIADGLEYPNAPRGIKIFRNGRSNIYQIRASQHLESGVIFELTGGGKVELRGQRWKTKFVGKGFLTLEFPNLPKEIFDDCDADTHEVGFTVGN